MAVKNRRCHFMNISKFILKQFEFRKTFDSLRGGKLAVFGDLAAILKIKKNSLQSNQ